MAPRSAASLLPRKKQRTGSKNDRYSTKTVADLEEHITLALNSNASLNPVADLLKGASFSDDAEVTLKAIFALYRVFTLIMQKGLVSSIPDEDADRKAVRVWTSSKLDAFTSLLCALLTSKEKTLRTSALKILFSILRQLSNHIPKVEDPSSSSLPLQFDVPFFRKIVQALLACSGNDDDEGDTVLETDVRDLFVDTWLNVYADIRWFFLRETGILLDKPKFLAQYSSMPANALSILERLTAMPIDDSTPQQFWIEGLSTKPKARKKSNGHEDSSDEEDEPMPDTKTTEEDDWRAFFDDPKPTDSPKKPKCKSQRIHTMTIHEQLHSVPAHRAVFTKCWLTLLPLFARPGESDDEEDEDQQNLALVTRALNILHRGVMPHLTRAVLIMDWIAGCVHYGGNVGLLALNALFILMQEYNLDYPKFYTRLYAFLDRNVLHLKHRSRFFRLTELFLSSSHLPATLLASFVKRLSRLSLSAPPAAIIMIIPFIYNILKRHPALMAMIHRTDVDIDYTDPFNPTEPDPTLTNALNSSLWELHSHRRHYHSTVSTMARIFEEAFTKPNYAMEDFLDHTYVTLFDTEVSRKIKKDPPVLEMEFAKPMTLRTRKTLESEENDEVELASQTDVVSALWVFG